MNRFWNIDKKCVKIKLCDIKSLDTAYESYQLGADAFGFHIRKKADIESKIKQIQYIVKYLPGDISCWLLTYIQDFSALRDILNRINFDTIQFQGNIEASEFLILAKQLKQPRNKEILKIVKTISVFGKYSDILEKIDMYIENVDAILLDSGSQEKGGTGSIHNWDISSKLVKKIKKPVILAGGLKPENVIEAIMKVKPFAVDVQSGVENIVGEFGGKKVKCKSIIKIEKFIRNIKRI